jgi:chemotaxis protein methyltransferase CheR
MLPAHLRERYFTARGDDAWEISPAIRTTVDFRWANLVAARTFADLGELDVVFCRNVFIYFSGAAISGVVAALARQMPGGAHLFVGAAESLLKLTDEYDLQELDDAFVYMRRARASA